MRIATAQLYQQGLRAIADLQANAARAQSEVATGKRLLSAADDPAAAAQALSARDLLSQTQRFDSNIEMARSRLDLEESVLVNVGNVLQRVRELAVRANNATVSDVDRAAIAAELEERLGELLSLANTRASGGEYIFAGFQSHTRPFASNAAGGFDYNGDQGQRLVRVSPSTQVAISDSGADVFRDIRTGNGTFSVSADPANTGAAVVDNGTVIDPNLWVDGRYTVNFVSATAYEVRDGDGTVIVGGSYQDGATLSFNGIEVTVTGTPASGDTFVVESSRNQNLFQTVDDLIQTLGISTPDAPSQAAVHQGVNQALANLDQALDNILVVRTRIGGRLNALDQEQQVNADMQVQIQTNISELEDVDLTEAASRLSRELFALEAAQQSFVRIQNLSLFSFL